MREKHVYAFLRIQDCTGRHRGTTDLTSLPLATVRHHGRSCVTQWNSVKFHLECKLHFPCAHLMLQQIHLTNVSESTEPGYRVCWLVNFFALIRAMKTALEFVILCSNRGLEIEVTTRQKKRISAVSAGACIRAWDLKVMRALGSHPRPLSCNLIDFELL